MSTEIAKRESFIERLNADYSANSELVVGSNERGREELASLNFPTTRDEFWKYTRTAKILKWPLLKASNTEISNPSSIEIEGWEGHNLVFVNGVYRDDLSKIHSNDNINLYTSLDEVPDEHLEKCLDLNLRQGEAFTALNKGYFDNALFIHVPKGVEETEMLKVVHVLNGQETFVQPRLILLAEKGSAIEMVEHYVNAGTGEKNFTNALNEYYLEQRSQVTVHQIIDEGLENAHIQSSEAVQERNSKLVYYAYTLSGGLIRHNWDIAVKEEGCQTELYGVMVASENQHMDHHTFVDHIAPNCESIEDFKGVFADKATGVFNGKVRVQRNAQKINAFQSNQNLLLSDDAVINSKPELEIYADDVKCSHGSTTGQLDDEALFYLRSRGISEKEARKMLVNAFLGDVLSRVENDKVSDYVYRQILERFDASKPAELSA